MKSTCSLFLLSLVTALGLGFAPPILSKTPETPAGASRSEARLDAVLERNRKLPDFSKLQALVKGKPGITWVITGDSITHGAAHTKGARSYPEHWAELIRWDRRRFNDVVINTGISGDTVSKRDGRDLGQLNKFDERIKRFSPQVVSVNTGMNDCSGGKNGLPRFERELTLLVQKIRALGAIPILQVPNPAAESDKNRNQQLALYDDIVRKVADRENVLLVDHAAHWHHFVEDGAKRREWMNDGLHPNGAGHIEMFKRMAWDLGFFDPGMPSCKLGYKTL